MNEIPTAPFPSNVPSETLPSSVLFPHNPQPSPKKRLWLIIITFVLALAIVCTGFFLVLHFFHTSSSPTAVEQLENYKTAFYNTIFDEEGAKSVDELIPEFVHFLDSNSNNPEIIAEGSVFLIELYKKAQDFPSAIILLEKLLQDSNIDDATRYGYTTRLIQLYDMVGDLKTKKIKIKELLTLPFPDIYPDDPDTALKPYRDELIRLENIP